MKQSTSAIKFYADSLLVESLFINQDLTKTAQVGSFIGSLIESVKNYISNNIDPNNKTKSILNLLAPGAISVLFGGKLGLLLGLATRVFHIDVVGIIENIINKLRSTLSDDKPISSTQVNQIVQESVDQHSPEPTPEDVQAFLQTQSFEQQLNETVFLKTAMVAYEKFLYKQADWRDYIPRFIASKTRSQNILAKVLGWIFNVAIASAGLMIAGDVINKFLGRPNALDGTIQKGKPIETSETTSTPTLPTFYTAKQTKFPINPNYQNNIHNTNNSHWMEKVSNNKSDIENMLIDFAKEVYSGLDGLENDIKTTAGFQVLSNKIVWYNRSAAGDPVIFIPPMFQTKKQIVDLFIDDVASKSTITPNKLKEEPNIPLAKQEKKPYIDA